MEDPGPSHEVEARLQLVKTRTAVFSWAGGGLVRG